MESPPAENGPPVPESLHRGSLADLRGVLRKFPLAIGQAKRLGELRSDYVFFTPALLYVVGTFADAPLIDFARQHPGFRIYYRLFSRPLFRGLDSRDGDPAWNFALWAVNRPYWQRFSDFLVSATLIEPDQQRVTAIGLQELRIADPLGSPIPQATWRLATLPIGVFGVRTARYTAVLAPDDPPRLVFYPGDTAVARMQTALYRTGRVTPLEKHS